MAMFSLNMMQIALELARDNQVYENIASKFFEHFLAIAEAMNNLGGQGIGLWDAEDEFFYDVLHLPDGRASASSSARWSASSRCSPSRPSSPTSCAACPASPSASSGTSTTAPTSPPWSRAGTSPASASAACSPWSAAAA
jgi:hypothetical protein